MTIAHINYLSTRFGSESMAKVCTMHLLTRLERAITLASESFIALKLINSSVGKLGFVIRAFDGHPSAENFLVFHYASFFFCALEKHLFISGNRLFGIICRF